MDFQQTVRKYHKSIRLHFYLAIFTNDKVENTNIKRYQLANYSPENSPKVWASLLSVSTLTVLLSGVGYFYLGRRV